VKRALAPALLLCLAAGAVGQEAPPADDTLRRLEALERRVEEQDRLIDELRADADAPAPPPTDDPSAPTLEVGWKDGLLLSGTVNGAPYEVRPIGRIQLDYRVFAHNDRNAQVPHPVPENRFLVRRARLGFSGRLSDFGFMFEVDPDRAGIPLGVFNFQWQRFEEVRVRFGHFRTPFALENGITGTNQLPWLERSMVIGSGNALAPGFSPGAMAFGTLAKTFSYYLSAQNRTDSSNQVTSDPLLGARLELTVSAFVFGASGVWTRQGGGLQDSVTGVTPAQHRFFAPVRVQGHDLRGSVDVSYFHGPFFVMAEYAYGEQERRRAITGGGDGSNFAVQGAYLGAGVVFWGPDATRPRGGAPFVGWRLLPDLDRPRLGRFRGAELIARVEWIDLDDRNGGRGSAAPSRGADAADIRGCDARALTVGLNLFPIENVRFSAHWTRVRVGDSGRTPDAGSHYEDEVVLRAQLDF
jgi:phosphate-selective porin